MPTYQFYGLGPAPQETPSVQMTLFADEAAMRRALGPQFPLGCDVWQDGRFVGRFHAPSPAAGQDPPDDEASGA